MVTRKARGKRAEATPASAQISTNPDDLLLAAIEAGDPSKTGRFLITFKEGATDEGVAHLESVRGFRTASTKDFTGQAALVEATGDADALVFPEIGVALVSSEAAVSRGMTAEAAIAEDSPVQSVDPEYFMFANSVNAADYMKGVLRMAQMISSDLSGAAETVEEIELEPAVVGATWGLIACRVPPGTRDGNGIKVAVL